MENKTASIVCWITIIGWLVAFFSCKDKKEISKSLSQGLITGLIACIPFLGIFGAVFEIIGLVKACQGDMNPELPIFGGLDFFNK